ncbi:MAG: DUF4126 domain-containing protein [Candidatus Thiosymbion ectosymbiont of Robbea hypermnestra]|nr:DUF4126 domain-containing protein [Candidatus Thiosymbion ectosymbiont of Robbea hypermnestra]
MEELTQTLALSLGAGWASGINLYAAVLVLGFLGATGRIELPAGMETLADPLVMFAAGIMYLVEFFVDKIPGLDTVWDTLHTFVRIPAGAILAAGAVGDVGVGAELAAGLLGGGLAAASHATKAGTRALINTSPEPFTNWTASIAEDVGVVAGLLVALDHPLLFLGLLALFLLLLVWLLPKLWRGIKRVFRTIAGWFGGGRKASESPGPGTRTLEAQSPGEGAERPPGPT